MANSKEEAADHLERTLKYDSISTVNVIDFSEMRDCNITRMKSFPDTEEGNEKAEATFTAWLRELWDNDTQGESLDDEIISARIEDGYFEVGTGMLVLTHSTE